MGNTQLTKPIKSQTEMLVRTPVSEVFEAIVNPDITNQFWFSKGSGRLDAGEPVRWDWEMYDVSIVVTPKAIEPEQIIIEWPGYSGPTTVTWDLLPQPDGTTFVHITEEGFEGDGDDLAADAIESTQGFTWMLAGLKAYLEHGIQLNLIADKHPTDLANAPA